MAEHTLLVHDLDEEVTRTDIQRLVSNTPKNVTVDRDTNVVENVYFPHTMVYNQTGPYNTDAPKGSRKGIIVFKDKGHADVFMKNVSSTMKIQWLPKQMYSSVQSIVNSDIIKRLRQKNTLASVLSDIHMQAGLLGAWGNGNTELCLEGLYWQVQEAEHILDKAYQNILEEFVKQNILNERESDIKLNDKVPSKANPLQHTDQLSYEEQTQKDALSSCVSSGRADVKVKTSTTKTMMDTNGVAKLEDYSTEPADLQKNRDESKVILSGMPDSLKPEVDNECSSSSEYTKITQFDPVPSRITLSNDTSSIESDFNDVKETLSEMHASAPLTVNTSTWLFVTKINSGLSKKVKELAHKHGVIFVREATSEPSKTVIKIYGRAIPSINETFKSIQHLVEGLDFRIEKKALPVTNIDIGQLQNRFSEVLITEEGDGKLFVVAMEDAIHDKWNKISAFCQEEEMKTRQCVPEKSILSNSDSEMMPSLTEPPGTEEQVFDRNLYEYMKVCHSDYIQQICKNNDVTLQEGYKDGDNIMINLLGQASNANQGMKDLISCYNDLHGTVGTETIPLCGDDLQQDTVDAIMKQMVDRYGSIVRATTDELIIVGPRKVLYKVKEAVGNSVSMPMDWDSGTKEDRREGFDTRGHQMQQKTLDPVGFKTKRGTRIIIHKADITKLRVDVIVNAANDTLWHGGGIAGAIAEAAGRELTSDCNTFIRKNGPLHVSKHYMSKAGLLPCKNVLHTVGPRWNDRGSVEEQTKCFKRLVETFENVVSFIYEKKLESVAIPAVSSGIYGFPQALGAEAMHTALVRFIDSFEATGNRPALEEVHLIDLDLGMLQCIHQQFRKDSCPINKCFMEMPLGDVRRIIESRMSTNSYTHASSSAGISESKSRHAGTDFEQGRKPPTRKMPVNNEGGKESGTKHDDSSGHKKDKGMPKGSYNRQHSNKSNDDNAHDYPPCKRSGKLEEPKSNIDTDSSEYKTPDNCPICMCPITEKKILPKCKHEFCKPCIDDCFAKVKPACPICNVAYGKVTGNQPEGTMNVERKGYMKLPGYERYGAIVIHYRFWNGTQGANHPFPGQQYFGTRRTAYLPDNAEGRKVLELLKKAFEAKLVFTVGRSTTSGNDNQVTWNDIHHKTNTNGGPSNFGYPDPGYLKRVQEELAAKGIV